MLAPNQKSNLASAPNLVLLGLGTAICAGLIVIIAIGNLTQKAGQYIFLYGLVFLLFSLACSLTLKYLKQLEHKQTVETPTQLKETLLIILGMAALFRLITIFGAPSLSTDQFRYTWEGRLITLGISPYQYAPDAPNLLSYRDNFWPLVQQKETSSPYPPLAQLLNVTEYSILGENLAGPKIAAALADLGTCIVLVWLLGLLGLDSRRVILYAWCPLPILEFGLSGHNDALMLVCLVGALGLTVQHRPTWAAIAVGLACLAKFTPFFVLPILMLGWHINNTNNKKKPSAANTAKDAFTNNKETGFWRGLWWLSWRSGLYPGLSIAIVVAGYLPFLLIGRGAIGSIFEYTGSWRDNDALLFSSLYDSVGALIAKLVTVAILGSIILVLVFQPTILQKLGLIRSVMLIFGVTLLVASTVHPWYITWVLVWLPLVWRDKAGLVWWDSAWLGFGLASQLIYLTYAGNTSLYSWIKPLEYVPLYAAALWTFIYLGRSLYKAIPANQTSLQPTCDQPVTAMPLIQNTKEF
jgi:hypothetical protein